jgi:hypothetical protein
MATKAELEAEIVGLKAKLEALGDTAKQPVGNPATEQRNGANEEADFNKSASDMKSFLADQPKVEVYVPLEIGESLKSNPFIPVTLNGYILNVPKGVRVEVPKPIADIIFESMNIYEVNSASPMRADRDETKDGVSVQDALA